MLTLKQNQVAFLCIKYSHNLRSLSNISTATEIPAEGTLGYRSLALAQQSQESAAFPLFPPVYSKEKVIKEKTEEH